MIVTQNDVLSFYLSFFSLSLAMVISFFFIIEHLYFLRHWQKVHKIDRRQVDDQKTAIGEIHFFRMTTYLGTYLE